MKSKNKDIENAFIQLQQTLHHYLRGRLPDSTLADDLLQDVFLKALVSQQKGKQLKNISGWLYTITRNTLIDYYRSKGRLTKDLDHNFPEDFNNESIVLKELSTCLRPFIEKLPSLYRDTLFATELEGKTMREVAENNRVSISAVKSRAARGRALLKQKLLSCCEIEMSGGVVVDYHKKPLSGCGENCT